MKNKLFNIFRIGVLAVVLGCTGCSLSSKNKSDEKINEISEMKVTYIDVGKGDCILIEKDDTNILIDAGYYDTSEKVTNYLQEEGIDNLDYFIMTHYDKDHVGGAATIASAFSIGKIFLPNYEGSSKYYRELMNVISMNSLDAENVSEDISFTLSGVNYTISASDVTYVAGDGDEEGNDNDVSLVMTADYGNDTYLFAGDIEKEGINCYLEADHGQFDVIKMPHHGRKAGNTDDLIDDVQPEIAIITDSSEDSADNKVLNLLEDADVITYQTSVCGSITVTGTGSGTYHVEVENP
ncbi:MAG: MBL fold metallo-hydrolase [Lachnospiraceae bacterium]|nr:MBL fold metallo-hydrolase [Lachnospiraceae bacterium]